jgi:hypothetical protein
MTVVDPQDKMLCADDKTQKKKQSHKGHKMRMAVKGLSVSNV